MFDQILFQEWKPAEVYGRTVASQVNGVRDPSLSVLKPHGSLNWHYRQTLEGVKKHEPRLPPEFVDCGTVIDGALDEDDYDLQVSENILARDHRDVQDVELVPPVGDKEAAASGGPFHNYAFRRRKLYEGIWREIDEAVAEVRTLLVVGYSLPPTDVKAIEVFSSARPTKVELLDPGEDAFRRWSQLFPGKVQQHRGVEALPEVVEELKRRDYFA